MNRSQFATSSVLLKLKNIMSKEITISQQHISNKIFTIRGEQIMLDRNLAEMYQVKAIRLREQVKRNQERFPENFMFRLTEEEVETMVSQNAIPSKQHLGGALPYAFTEQGVAMLSSVLRSDIAVKVSIQIINAFVQMRKLVGQQTVQQLRFSNIENKLVEHDQKFEQIFKAIESKDLPQKGIFYDGQVFDAYNFVADIIREAKTSVILIDNYIDDSVFTLFTKRKKDVACTCYTQKLTKSLQLDLKKHNQQYPPIELKALKTTHDRFLIIDEKELYHLGASLKDLGKKWFGFSRMDSLCNDVLNKLKGGKDE